MNRTRISSGSTFEAQIGYSRAIVDGDWVFVSGTTGFDYSRMTIADDVVEQADQCLKNIEAALSQAGASLQDVVRVTYVLPDGAAFERCWPVLQRYFGEVRPAAMMISAGLADPRMKIEIEVTALKRPDASPSEAALLTVYTTVATQDEARRMARALVERQLVACAQITPVDSFYTWNGAVQQDSEYRLMLKTTQALYAAVEAAVRELHSYELPAIHAEPVVRAEPAYAAWVRASTTAAGRPADRPVHPQVA